MAALTAPYCNDSVIAAARAARIEDIAVALMPHGARLRRSGHHLVGPCPVCGGTDRFRITPAKNLWHCRRDCARGGDTIALMMHARRLSFPEAVAALASEKFVERPSGAPPSRPTPCPQTLRGPREDPQRGVTSLVRHLWNQAGPIAGTPGEAWLGKRGIRLNDVPEGGGLRYHPTCPYGPGRTMPCILARLTDAVTGQWCGLHRRALAPPPGSPKTMTLGSLGGAVVRLWPDEDVTMGLVIGEGVETVLAAATAIEWRHTLLQPAWACTTAGNLGSFPVLPGIEALTILADHDGAGVEAAKRCTRRWADAGREVTALVPALAGTDFNDIVAGRARDDA